MSSFAELADLLNKKSKEQAHATRSRNRATQQRKQAKKENRANV